MPAVVGKAARASGFTGIVLEAVGSKAYCICCTRLRLMESVSGGDTLGGGLSQGPVQERLIAQAALELPL